MSRYAHRPPDHIELVALIIECSGHSESFLWNTTQQGDTFVPGEEARESRVKRIKKTIQAVDSQFSNQNVAQQQSQGPGVPLGSENNNVQHQDAQRSEITADLKGVGQQFHNHTQH